MDSSAGTPATQREIVIASPREPKEVPEIGRHSHLRLLVWIVIAISAANLLSAALSAGSIPWASGLGVAIHSALTVALLLGLLYPLAIRPLLRRIVQGSEERAQILKLKQELEKTLAERESDVANLKSKLSSETTSRQRAEEDVRRLNQDLERKVLERTSRLEGANRDLNSHLLEQRKSTDALRESEKRYRRLAEIANDGIWTINAEGKTNFLNTNGAALLGYTVPELLGRAPDEIVVTEDLPPGLRKFDLQHRPGAEVLDVRMRRKDRRELWMRWSISPILGDQKDYLGALIIFSDISVRKRAEQRLQEQTTLLDLAQDGFILCDPGLHVLSWNEGATRFYGWTADEMIGRDAFEILADKNAPNLKQEILGTLLEKTTWRGELSQVSKDGKRLTVDARLNMTVPAPGKPGSVLLITTDISQQKKREAQLIREQRMESASSIAAGLVQDLNNLLAPVLLSAQMLRSKRLEAEDRELVATIETSAARSADVLRQALIFARGVDGERVLIDPSHLLRETSDITREIFPRNIQILSEIQSSCGNLKGDPVQLHQVLIKLCVRARDAMPNGGTLWLLSRSIELDPDMPIVRAGLPAGSYILIQVQDTGASIPRPMLERIFEPYSTPAQDGKGTGLGLSAALGIIKSHGGTIEVQSSPSAGTTFDIFLPAATEAADFTAKPSLERPVGRGELILMVEDEAALRDVAKRTLHKCGYEVLSAADGVEALGILAEHQGRVRLVLTTMVTPSMDGPSLARAALRIDPQIRIIASSGLGRSLGQADKLAALQSLGITRLLDKPYSAEELLRAVRDELAQPKKGGF